MNIFNTRRRGVTRECVPTLFSTWDTIPILDYCNSLFNRPEHQQHAFVLWKIIAGDTVSGELLHELCIKFPGIVQENGELHPRIESFHSTFKADLEKIVRQYKGKGKDQSQEESEQPDSPRP